MKVVVHFFCFFILGSAFLGLLDSEGLLSRLPPATTFFSSFFLLMFSFCFLGADADDEDLCADFSFLSFFCSLSAAFTSRLFCFGLSSAFAALTSFFATSFLTGADLLSLDTDLIYCFTIFCILAGLSLFFSTSTIACCSSTGATFDSSTGLAVDLLLGAADFFLLSFDLDCDFDCFDFVLTSFFCGYFLPSDLDLDLVLDVLVG